MTSASRPHVLVTGAAGFIGFHLVRALLATGRPVLGLDNLNDYYDPALKQARLAELEAHPDFLFRRVDLADREGMDALFDEWRPTHGVHLGAQAGVRYSLDQPFAYADSNLTGTLTVLEGCRRYEVAHLLYASSSSVYGANRRVPFTEADGVDHPLSLYAATKRAGELMAHTYSHLYGLPTTGLRFFTVYGPWGRPDMAYYKFARAIREGRPIQLYNNGHLTRDFTYVDDVVAAMLRLVDQAPAAAPEVATAAHGPHRSSAPFRLYNIGNHTPVTLDTFVATLERCLGQEAIKEYVGMQSGDVLETFADVEALTAATQFAPRTKLADGLAAFVDWFDRYHDYA